MVNKVLKIAILISPLIFSSFLSSGQLNQKISDTVLKRYNQYLFERKLGTVVTAASLEYHNSYQLGNKNDPTILNKVQVLHLKPVHSELGPMRFLGTWNTVLRKIQSHSTLESQLLFELAALTRLPPSSLIIQIGDDSEDGYAYFVYYQQEVKILPPTVQVKGVDPNAPQIGPGDLTDSMFGGFISGIADKKGIRERIKAIVENFLASENKLHVKERKQYGENAYSFVAAGKSRVTDGFNEIVTLYVTIIPSPKDSTIDIQFHFMINYSADHMNISDAMLYRNAIACCPGKVSGFGGDLNYLLAKLK